MRVTSRSLSAAPKRGAIVDTYQTVNVLCAKCNTQLFRYKKRNGTKSALVKCYVERIVEDTASVLASPPPTSSRDAVETIENNVDIESIDDDHQYSCPKCQTRFARPAMIRGLPALKLVGGKVRMTK